MELCPQCLPAGAVGAALLGAAAAGWRSGQLPIPARTACPRCSTLPGPAAAVGQVKQRTTVTNAPGGVRRRGAASKACST